MGQPGIVDAHVHTLVQRLDGREHGQDLLLVGQVALVRNQCAAVACALTFCCQLLKNTMSDPVRPHEFVEEDNITHCELPQMKYKKEVYVD